MDQTDKIGIINRYQSNPERPQLAGAKCQNCGQSLMIVMATVDKAGGTNHTILALAGVARRGIVLMRRHRLGLEMRSLRNWRQRRILDFWSSQIYNGDN